jgi:hypothetical protein
MDYTIYLIDRTAEYYNVIQEGILPEKLLYFDGNGYTSFSQLVNSCIAQSPTELVIILSYKVRPTADQIRAMVDLLKRGYAFVSKQNFRCFGLHKETLRRIGMFDERFEGGGFEDYDIVARLNESKLPIHITTEVEHIEKPSTWAIDGGSVYAGYEFWIDKWWHPNHDLGIIIRVLPEQEYEYNLGYQLGTEFLDSIHNHVDSYHFIPFSLMKYCSGLPKN